MATRKKKAAPRLGADDYITRQSVTADDLKGLPRVALEPEKKSQAQRLVELVPEEALFRSTDGETAFATLPAGDHLETWPVRSKGFRRWLVGRFYQMDEKPPRAQALMDAIGALEARAQFGGQVHDVHVRLGGNAEAIYLDLGNPRWEAVEVTATGWCIVGDPPVKFRRPKGMLPLPHPITGGSILELRKFVNVRDDAQWALLIAWQLAALRPTGPYPVLNLNSEHGSGKTTTAEVLRRLIDPNSAVLRAEPRDVRDVMIAATNSWMVAFDNLSELPPWLSDCLCRLSTGGGFSTRELYSDMDEMIFSAQRPALLNGIEEIVTRGDLLDRSLLLDLPPIPEHRRRAAVEFWREFEAARPRLLGALLDGLSTALRRAPTVKLTKLPRMADFALWATAAAPALGWSDDYFMSIYSANREQAHELALDASPVAPVIRTLAERGEWSGTATELLEALSGLADEIIRRSKGWPTTPRYLGTILRRLAPNLRAIGIQVELADRRELGPRRRQISIMKAVPSSAGDQKDAAGERSHRSQCSDADLQDSFAFRGNGGPFPGNDGWSAGTPRRNNGNAGNDAAPIVSDGDVEGEL
jgi:hypothetical protein